MKSSIFTAILILTLSCQIFSKPQNTNSTLSIQDLKDFDLDSGSGSNTKKPSEKLLDNDTKNELLQSDSLKDLQIPDVEQPVQVTEPTTKNDSETIVQKKVSSKESFKVLWQKFLDSPDDEKFQALAELLMTHVIWFVVIFISTLLACCACLWLTICCCCIRNNN